MKLLGFEITRLTEKAQPPQLYPPSQRGWYPVVRDWYAGAWQRNDEIRVDSVLAYHAVFACVTLISQDVGKLRPKLVQKVGEVWPETESPAFSPVLRRPNHYQNHQQFKEWWVISRLVRGNTYALEAARQPRRRRGALPARPVPREGADLDLGRRSSTNCQTDNLSGHRGDLGHRAGLRDHSRPDELPLSPADGPLADLRLRARRAAGARDPKRLDRLLRQHVAPVAGF